MSVRWPLAHQYSLEIPMSCWHRKTCAWGKSKSKHQCLASKYRDCAFSFLATFTSSGLWILQMCNIPCQCLAGLGLLWIWKWTAAIMVCVFFMPFSSQTSSEVSKGLRHSPCPKFNGASTTKKPLYYLLWQSSYALFAMQDMLQEQSYVFCLVHMSSSIVHAPSTELYSRIFLARA